jgi:predicted Zn-dependent protease
LRDSANAFSREEERQADTRGFELATAAGYDPKQSVELWQEELDEEAVMPKSSDFQELAANHPPTADRLTSMRAMAAAAEPQKAHWETGTQSYQGVIRPFRMQWLAENLALAHFDESLAMLQALMKSEPHSSALHYYLGEVYRRRNSNGDAAKALAAYHEAVADAGAPGEAWRGLGLVSLKSGDKGTARTALQKYLTATPAADDRDMIEFYLSQISGAQ